MRMACSVVVAAPLASCGVDPLGDRATPTRQPPGQTDLLEPSKQGAGWVFLDWKAPADGGGKPKAYKVQRRSGESWGNIATAIITEATLVEQPGNNQLEYRIIAVKKAGGGPESNTVRAVL